MNKPQVLAHRGNFSPEGPIPQVQGSFKVPENTLEAFERALQKGWGVETDVRVLADGNFVIIHDEDLVRFSGKNDFVDQMKLSDIKKVEYKNNPDFIIPTLNDLCLLSQKYIKSGRSAFIAFQIKRGKDPDSGVKAGRGIAKNIEIYGLKDSIIFDATFEEAEVLRKEFPKINLSVSVGEKNYSPTIYTPDQVFSQDFLKVFNCVWADEWIESGSIYTKKMFEKFRSAFEGRIDVVSPELHYSQNHALSKDIKKLKNLWKKIISFEAADGVCTDYPTELSRL